MPPQNPISTVSAPAAPYAVQRPFGFRPQKPAAPVDTSNVRPGILVKHKAFGVGQVKSIEKGVVVVVFDGMDKKFQFPGAFEQGFLQIEE